MATKIINNWPTKCKTFYSYKVLASTEQNVKIFPRTNHTFQETYLCTYEEIMTVRNFASKNASV